MIYLLQSRPITTLNLYTNFELQHELDTPIMSGDEYSTFANVGEVSRVYIVNIRNKSR